MTTEIIDFRQTNIHIKIESHHHPENILAPVMKDENKS